ncbi:MAG: hypothetical protein IKX70_08175 [Treponema sp.]|nr:hypothetical protein [Treponema sp.]
MKKVLFKIGLMMMFAVLFVACGGNGGNPDTNNNTPSGSTISISETGIEIDTNTITLSDGTWNYDIKLPQNYVEYGTFIVSNQTLTYTLVYEGKNSYVTEMSEIRLNNKNSNPTSNYSNDFNYSTANNSSDVTCSIQKNQNNTKFKCIFTNSSGTTTTLLEKIQ